VNAGKHFIFQGDNSELVIKDNDNVLEVSLEYSIRFGREPSAAFIKRSIKFACKES
jgi:hypothetical protein